MVSTTVAQEPVIGQVAQGGDHAWEEHCYRLGGTRAQREAARRLQALEQGRHA